MIYDSLKTVATARLKLDLIKYIHYQNPRTAEATGFI